MGLVTGDIVGPQPVQRTAGSLQGQHQALAQGVFCDTVLIHGIAGGILVNAALPVAHLMHGSHHGQGGQTALHHVVQKRHMGGKVLHVGIRIVTEPVPPRQMDADIRAAKTAVNVLLRTEQRVIAKFRTLVHTLECKIRRDHRISLIQRLFHNMAANIAGRTGHKNGFHRCSSRFGMSSYRFCKCSSNSSRASACFPVAPRSPRG